MLIPYSTDAPIYHLPIVTVNMIALNIAAFSGMIYMWNVMPQEQFEFWLNAVVLQYGQGLKPWQWITSAFMHADIFHLLGNMFCLWGFGLVVEGKVGWWRFLLIFFGIGITQSAFEQTVMLFAEEGASLGASSIVYGLLAIAMLWAPENEMSCVFLFFYRFFVFDMKLSALAATALFIELGVGMFAGLTMSSQVLHLMGAAVGFGVGYVMLKRDWVDCEGWDFFSVWSGKERSKSEEESDEAFALIKAAEDARVASVATPAAAVVDEPLRLDVDDQPLEPITVATVEEVRQALTEQDPTKALALYRELPDAPLPPERELLEIITLMHQQKQWSASLPAMLLYLSRFQRQASRIRLRLAHVLLEVERRPRQALSVLAKVDTTKLADVEQTTLNKLTAKAEGMQSELPNEQPVRDW